VHARFHTHIYYYSASFADVIHIQVELLPHLEWHISTNKKYNYIRKKSNINLEMVGFQQITCRFYKDAVQFKF
jgi:hypothetical protein